MNIRSKMQAGEKKLRYKLGLYYNKVDNKSKFKMVKIKRLLIFFLCILMLVSKCIDGAIPNIIFFSS